MAASKQQRVVLVTGGGAGIGLEIARTFALLGDEVVICGRSADRLEKAVESSAENQQLSAFSCDIADQQSVAKLAAFIEDRFGRLDVLVNNAGAFHLGDITKATTEQFDEIVATNFRAPFLMTKTMLPLIEKSDGGRIINISASYADDLKPHPQFGIFAAANSALLSMTRTLALELASAMITVNSVGPGMIEGPAYSRQTNKRYAELIPAGRLGFASEVAAAVKFLAEPGSSYITGSHVPISGGWQGQVDS
jgi:NAD(P)-dependent dehydrogenase (short-subunit alcohol dehydrogenase family)